MVTGDSTLDPHRLSFFLGGLPSQAGPPSHAWAKAADNDGPESLDFELSPDLSESWLGLLVVEVPEVLPIALELLAPGVLAELLLGAMVLNYGNGTHDPPTFVSVTLGGRCADPRGSLG